MGGDLTPGLSLLVYSGIEVLLLERSPARAVSPVHLQAVGFLRGIKNLVSAYI